MQRKVKKEFVIYQGRSIPKEHFRVFVYNQTGEHLVQSYEEFKACLATKEWFETKAEALAPKASPKPRVRKAAIREVTKEVINHDTDSARVCE